MIHGIHGGETRTTDYEFVRGGRQGYYNWSDVVFPGRAADCLTCHKPGTYAVPLDDDTLLTTNRTTGVANWARPRLSALSARPGISVPNVTDFVITPTAAACYACHDSTDAIGHMEQNGAIINDNRSVVLAAGSVETCSVCHGTGKTADLAVVHAAAEAATVIGRITAPESSGGSGDGDQSQVTLCGPGPISAQPAGHTTRLDCCSCHGFN